MSRKQPAREVQAMLYRIEVAGRIFESPDPRILVRLAVMVRRGERVMIEKPDCAAQGVSELADSPGLFS